MLTIDKNTSIDHDARIQIFNPNGDSAEACGNGTRCVAKLLFDESHKNKLNIRSDAGILHAIRLDDSNISVNLGKLSTDWKKIPLSENIDPLNLPLTIDGFSNGIAVNIGNPHVVFFGKNIDQVDLA